MLMVLSQWVKQNIEYFGGDPDQITIIGDSAGGGSVRVLLGSPPANGKFQGGIAMSSLGGGVTLGLSGDYGTTYASYLTPEESYTKYGKPAIQTLGCNQTTVEGQAACLRGLNATYIAVNTGVYYVVQDGTFVNTEELDVVNRNGSTAHVHTMWGTTRDEGASIGATYPSTPVSNETAGIMASLGISEYWANQIIESGLFPYYDTGNVTFDSFNVSARVATDKVFRCVDEATVYAGSVSGAFKSSYYYQFERTEGGYDPNGIGGTTNNNPELPYFRFHSSDLQWVFGLLSVLRDDRDLPSVHLVMSYFASFVKTGNPNAEYSYLKVRGYDDVLSAVEATGAWEPVSSRNGPIRKLDYPSTAAHFVDVPQCAWLNYSLSYYLDGGM